MNELSTWLTAALSTGLIYDVGGRLLRFLALLVIAWVVVHMVRRALPRLLRTMGRRMPRRLGESEDELAKRSETLGGIVISVVILGVWVIAVLMALRELGFDIGPVLAGAGVVGLAVGFGAQNLVRDVISGAFMLFENQVRVGDVASINGTGGLVERMNLRTITLRGLDGTVHVFPNGTINTLSNMTLDHSYYVFDVGVAYKEDTDQVVAVLEELGRGLQEDATYSADILAPIEVLGVDAFEDSAVIVKARLKTKPSRQWAVGREMNRRIKKRFDEVGIEIPFPHQTVFFGDSAASSANGRRALRANGAKPSGSLPSPTP